MRARTLFLIVAIVVACLFALLNWSEFTRMTPLSFGWTVSDASLPLILLGALILTLLWFVISSATTRTRVLRESRGHAKALQAQRDLAERAEASRLTDLRQLIDTQTRESRQHDAAIAAEMEKSRAEQQRELRNQLEQLNRVLDGRLREIESRLPHGSTYGDGTIVQRPAVVTPR